jgi:hypothetical protein
MSAFGRYTSPCVTVIADRWLLTTFYSKLRRKLNFFVFVAFASSSAVLPTIKKTPPLPPHPRVKEEGEERGWEKEREGGKRRRRGRREGVGGEREGSEESERGDEREMKKKKDVSFPHLLLRTLN